jgi:D-arabinose 1-dehydrogenase-like Zn-dependent alcohol dehydrogenase
VVDRLGDGVSGIEPGQTVAAMPISGAYAEFVCLQQGKLVPVPSGLDAAEAVSLVLNYITAYQMLHRSVKARPGQRMLIHGASGGVGSAMLQLAKLADVEMYGTCVGSGAAVVRDLGGIPIGMVRDGKTPEAGSYLRQTVEKKDAAGKPVAWLAEEFPAASRETLQQQGILSLLVLPMSPKEKHLFSGGSILSSLRTERPYCVGSTAILY